VSDRRTLQELGAISQCAFLLDTLGAISEEVAQKTSSKAPPGESD